MLDLTLQTLKLNYSLLMSYVKRQCILVPKKSHYNILIQLVPSHKQGILCMCTGMLCPEDTDDDVHVRR